MAYTVTRDKTVFGNKASVIVKIIADAATEAVPSGLSRIDGISVGKSSMGTANIHIAVNKGLSGTAAAGTLGITGCASGDEFYVVVYGTR